MKKISRVILICFGILLPARLHAGEQHGCGNQSIVSFKAAWIKVEPTRPMTYRDAAGNPVVISSNGTTIIAKIPEAERRQISLFARDNQSCVISIKYAGKVVKKELAKVILPLSSGGIQDDSFLGLVLNEDEVDEHQLEFLRRNISEISLISE